MAFVPVFAGLGSGRRRQSGGGDAAVWNKGLSGCSPFRRCSGAGESMEYPSGLVGGCTGACLCQINLHGRWGLAARRCRSSLRCCVVRDGVVSAGAPVLAPALPPLRLEEGHHLVGSAEGCFLPLKRAVLATAGVCGPSPAAHAMLKSLGGSSMLQLRRRVSGRRKKTAFGLRCNFLVFLGRCAMSLAVLCFP